MNATDTIFALALASNLHPKQHLDFAIAQLQQLGQVKFSAVYCIPCRDAVGADYWNCACLMRSSASPEQIILLLKQLEQDSGRIRPSHHISLDVDLIAWGTDLSAMQFNQKKFPLPLDVKVPLFELWPHAFFSHPVHQFPTVCLDRPYSQVG